MKREMKLIFISWAPHCTRSDSIARRFGAESIKIHYGSFKKIYFAPVKYILQSFKTLTFLYQKNPDVVFVMNPPLFSGLVVWLYCFLCRKKFILDSHSAVFTDLKWKMFRFLHIFLIRRALVSIVTNEHWGEQIRKYGGRYFIIPDVPVEFEKKVKIDLPKPHITIINNFSRDEPIEEILKAVAKLPEIHFSMTGNLKRCKGAFLKMKPPNLEFTGFLPSEDYVNRIYSSDAVLVLTTRNYTMQRGAYEAMALCVPIITSDWHILQSTFYKGAIFVDNTIDGIEKGVREIIRNNERYKQEVVELKEERLKFWEKLEKEFKQEFL